MLLLVVVVVVLARAGSIATTDRSIAFPQPAVQKVCMRVSLQPALSASTTDSTTVGRQRRKGHSGRKNTKRGRGGEVRKEHGGVKMEKWGSQNEVVGRSKKSRGEVKMKWGGGQKRAEAGSWGDVKKKQGGCQKEVAIQ